MERRYLFALAVIYAVAIILAAAVLVLEHFALIIASVAALSAAGIAQFSFLGKLMVPKEERTAQTEATKRMEANVHALSGDVQQLRQDLSRAVWSLQQRMPTEKQYVDLLEKIIEVENRIARLRGELRPEGY